MTAGERLSDLLNQTEIALMSVHGFQRIPVEMIPTTKCSHYYKIKVEESQIHERRKTKT